MPLPIVNVTGNVYLPSGAGATGSIEIQLAQGIGSVDDGTTQQAVAPRSRVVIGAAGLVDFDLIPTSEITVENGGAAAYRARWSIDNDEWMEYWTIGNNDIDIGDITRLMEPPLGVGALLENPMAQLIDFPAGSLYRGRFLYEPGINGTEDELYICMKGWDDVYRWKTILRGGGGL